MSKQRRMEELLHDMMGDLMLLHQVTKSERLKRRIEDWVDRTLKVLDSENNGPTK
jgi:hypothetical protein